MKTARVQVALVQRVRLGLRRGPLRGGRHGVGSGGPTLALLDRDHIALRHAFRRRIAVRVRRVLRHWCKRQHIINNRFIFDSLIYFRKRTRCALDGNRSPLQHSEKSVKLDGLSCFPQATSSSWNSSAHTNA